jgi:hypothetical protein
MFTYRFTWPGSGELTLENKGKKNFTQENQQDIFQSLFLAQEYSL